ncbi:hypothetical protein ENBRE01_3522, partial [Enteropsectra breve]
MNEDERASHDKFQEIKEANPNLYGVELNEKLYATPEHKQQMKNERGNNLSESDKFIIKVRNDLLKGMRSSYASLREAIDDLEEYRKNKVKEKVKKAECDLREWINSLNCTPFDTAEKDNPGQYLLDYETMCFLVSFLRLDITFEQLLRENNFDSAKQPFLSLFKEISYCESTSESMFKEVIEMESKPFISYNEMMKFIVENIFKEDVRFVEVLCNKIEMISR